MVDDRVIVDMLTVGENEQAIEREAGALAGQSDIDFVPNQAAAEGDVSRGDVARAFLVNLHGSDVERIGRFALDLVMIDVRSFAGDDLRDRISEVIAGSNE